MGIAVKAVFWDVLEDRVYIKLELSMSPVSCVLPPAPAPVPILPPAEPPSPATSSRKTPGPDYA